jgi:DNA-binding response OmpR family regulator
MLNAAERPSLAESPRVLVVEDDEDARRLLAAVLLRVGLEVVEAASGSHALRCLFEERPACVLLDLGLPEVSGWDVLDRIRELTDVPVVILSAQASEPAKVRALQAGANDYVTKPFGRQELVARIQRLVRPRTGVASVPDAYTDSFVVIDFRQRLVIVAGRPVALTPLEFRLLAILVRHCGQVLNQEQLLEFVWGDAAHVSPAQVKVYVGYLRRKLGFAADSGPIETVRGFGYAYRARRRSDRRGLAAGT